MQAPWLIHVARRTRLSEPCAAVRNRTSKRKHRRASILVGLLWCVVLLSLVVVSVLHTSRMDLMVVKNFGDRVQAHYLAVAGIEKAKALLYRDAHQRSRSAVNHNGELYNAPDEFRDVRFGRGRFRVLRRARADEGGAVAYGISDEESRINVNTASLEMMTNLDGLTPQIFASIAAWRGEGNNSPDGAADSDYYLSLQPPYQPRKGPLQTVRELLLVKDITPELLLGSDTRQNGMLPTAEDDSEESRGGDVSSPGMDTGWADLLTVDSTDKNVSASGTDRVNVQTADEAALTGVQGITSDIARAITAYRGQHQFQSIIDLLDVTPPQNNPNQPGGNPIGGTAAGPNVISQDLLLDIADEVTTSSDTDQKGLIDINTAGLQVLSCLPGVDRDLAQAIISYRQSSGYFPNIAWLMKVQGMNPDLLKQIAPLVSARSETFRILSEGKVDSTGTRQRIQAIVHLGLNDLETLSYREDDL